MLTRGPALPASAAAVVQVLREAGYQMEEVPTRPYAIDRAEFRLVTEGHGCGQSLPSTFRKICQIGFSHLDMYMTMYLLKCEIL